MRRYQYSDEIAEVVKKFLEEDEWNYSFDDETGLFRFDLRIRSKIQKINYAIDVHKDEISLYMVFHRLQQILMLLSAWYTWQNLFAIQTMVSKMDVLSLTSKMEKSALEAILIAIIICPLLKLSKIVCIV